MQNTVKQDRCSYLHVSAYHRHLRTARVGRNMQGQILILFYCILCYNVHYVGFIVTNNSEGARWKGTTKYYIVKFKVLMGFR
jgi:hypothetical protein